VSDAPDILTCTDLAIGHGKTVIMDRLNLSLAPGKILAIVGPSGCGKSTLMRALGGLDEPLGGKTTLMGVDLAKADGQVRQDILRRSGFLFQGAALFSSLTLRENIEMPMREFLNAPRKDIRQLAEYKLALVGLADAMDKLPSEISGGMAKRAGIARAMALDPAVIFLDEPSAGLDPVSSGRLDELILRLREAYGTTIVLVSHEIPSILRTADFCVYLDPDTGTMGAYGPPKSFLQAGQSPKVHAFFSQARID
jgi:phospholipid/cholesterol/gamma-HCH transport system ATP-binding protein